MGMATMSTHITRRKFMATAALACAVGGWRLQAADAKLKPSRIAVEDAVLRDLKT
jgi:hypothetical protein